MFGPNHPRPNLVVDQEFTRCLIKGTLDGKPEPCERPWNIPTAFLSKPQYTPDPHENRKTIIAALNPVLTCKNDIDLMLRSKIQTFVILLKYGNVEQHNQLIDALKQSIEEFEATHFGKCGPVVVGAELRTHKFRTGRLADGELQFTDGDPIELTWDRNYSFCGDFNRVYVNLATIHQRVDIGSMLKVGRDVVLKIQEIDSDQSILHCLVMIGGIFYSHASVELSNFKGAGQETLEDFVFAQQHNLDFAVIVDLDREPAEVLQKICKQNNRLQMFGKLCLNVVAPMIQPYLVKYFDGFCGDLCEIALWTAPLINEFIEQAASHHLPICCYISDRKTEIKTHEGLDSVMLEWPQCFDKSQQSLLTENVQRFIQIRPKASEFATPVGASNMLLGMMLSLKHLSITIQPSAIILLSRTGRSAQTLAGLDPPSKIIVITTSRRVACILRFIRNLEPLWLPGNSEENERQINVAIDFYNNSYPSSIKASPLKFLCCYPSKRNGKFPNVIRIVENGTKSFN